MSDDFVFNGIDGATGEYLLPPLPAAEVARLARGEVIAPDHLAELRARRRRDTEPSFLPAEGTDPKDLATTGWGVVFADDADPGVRDALKAAPGIEIVEAYDIKEDAVRCAEIIATGSRRYPDLGAWLSVGGWPVFTRNALAGVDSSKTKVISFDTVESAIPKQNAISAPVIRKRRSAAIATTRSSGVRCGTDLGAEERSSNCRSPSR